MGYFGSLGSFGYLWVHWGCLLVPLGPLVLLVASFGPSGSVSFCATFDILWALWYPVDPFGLILVPLATFGYWSLIPFWGVLLSPLGHISLALSLYIYIYIYIYLYLYMYMYIIA